MGSGLRPNRRRLYVAGIVVTGLGLLLVLPVVFAVFPILGKGAARVLQVGLFVRLLCGVGGPVLIGVGYALMAAGSPGLGEAISREVDDLFGVETSEDEGAAEADREGSDSTDFDEPPHEEPDAEDAQIFVRCRDCRTLNPEAEKHCRTCGAEL